MRLHIRKIFFGFRLKECIQGEDIGVKNRTAADLTGPHFGVQAVRGKFVRFRPPPPSLPAGFAIKEFSGRRSGPGEWRPSLGPVDV